MYGDGGRTGEGRGTAPEASTSQGAQQPPNYYGGPHPANQPPPHPQHFQHSSEGGWGYGGHPQAHYGGQGMQHYAYPYPPHAQVGPAPGGYHHQGWQYGQYGGYNAQQQAYGYPSHPAQWSCGWQHHPVAPQHYGGSGQRPQPSVEKRADRGSAPASSVQDPSPPVVLECKNCQRTFKHKSQLAAHLSTHQICGYKGCTFSATEKVLKEHRERVHFKTKPQASAPKPAASPEDEEELRAYLAERRANYPTRENLKRKLEEEQKRSELGQLEPNGERSKRMKRLKEVLQTQKKMGVAKIAGTDKIGKTMVASPARGMAKEDETPQGKAKGKKPKEAKGASLVPDYSDTDTGEDEEVGGGRSQEKKAGAEAGARGAAGKPQKRRNNGTPAKGRKNQNKRKPGQNKEESLISKLLAKSIRKEKSHILQSTKSVPGAAGLVKTYVHIDKEEDGISAYVFKHPLPSNLKCILCGKLFEDPVLTPAGYTYCYKCIRERIKSTGTCPISGRPLTDEQLEPNELAITLIDQIEVFPAKRLGKHWVPITDKTKKKITFGLRRLYKNTYLKSSARRRREKEDETTKDASVADQYDIYELFTYLIIVSLVVYGVLHTEFLGGQLRKARVPLTIMLSVPGILLVLYVIIEAVYASVNYEDDFSSEEEEEEEED